VHQRGKGITNTIQLRPRATPLEVKAKIEEAFERNAEMAPTRSSSKRIAVR
jgi:hypothetical protein